MKKIFLAALIVCTAFLFSCNNAGSGDPKAVLGEFFDALSKKDYATVRKLSTAESQSLIGLLEMNTKNLPGEKESDKFDKSKVQFGEPKIEGDKATVPTKTIESGETLNFTLRKEGGAWKVAFDKSSLMTMSMEKMSEKGIDIMDTVRSGMDRMQDMNVDSVKAGMNEAMKSLDSLKKEMDKKQ